MSPLVEPEPAPPTPSLGTIYLVDEQEQGRHILGSSPDELESEGVHFRVSVVPENQPSFWLSVNPAGVNGVNGTHLVADDGVAPSQDHIGTDPWFEGLILNGPGGQLKIRGSATVGSTILSTVYFLDYRSVTLGGVGPWVDYCGDAMGGAIPISGYYDAQRVHQPGSWISFACADGVARKCNSWGYIAGNAGPGDVNWSYHQACTGMANANYCGTGRSFTRDKTPIKIRDEVPGYASDDGPYDLTHPVALPGNPDTHYIEAGWLPNGMPLCLSKLRWASLAPNQCGAALPDPRFTDSKDRRAKFCDDWTVQQLFAAGALIVNGSKMMDAPLHRWRNAGGDDVSTIRGYFIDRNLDGIADAASTLPFPGYNVHVGVEGMLLRNLPGTLSESQMRPLYMRTSTAGDRYLDDIGSGRSDPSFEGYSFLSQTTVGTDGTAVSGLAPLNLCHRSGDLDTEWEALNDCTFTKSLSYALPAP